MKHIVTYLEAKNEPVMFTNSILGNYPFEVDFGELPLEESPLAEINVQLELLHCTLTIILP